MGEMGVEFGFRPVTSGIDIDGKALGAGRPIGIVANRRISIIGTGLLAAVAAEYPGGYVPCQLGGWFV